MQDLKALAEYVRTHLSRPGVSTHTIADRAGAGLSHGTVWNIANLQTKEVKESTLVALARGLGVSAEEVIGVVRGQPTEYADPFEALRIYFHGWEEATEEDRREVMGAIKLVGEAFRQRQASRPKPTTGKHRVRVEHGQRENPGRRRKAV